MNTNPINPEFGARAVSVYGGADALDDFPVLKAFQQYIDAEQAKARKRLLALGVFFGVLMLAVIAIFVVLLVSVSSRNQLLNDRLVEFAMKDRAASAPVVVQPPQDSAAVLAIAARLDEMQRKLAEAQEKSEKAEAEACRRAEQQAAAAAAKPKAPTPEELEIQRLKAALAAEKEKTAEEQKRRREEELEAYRRKHYPELYAPRQPPSRSVTTTSRVPVTREVVDQILADLNCPDDDTPAGDNKAKGEKPSSATNTSAADKAQTTGNAETNALSPISYFEDDEGASAPEKAHTLRIKSGETSLDWGVPD